MSVVLSLSPVFRNLPDFLSRIKAKTLSFKYVFPTKGFHKCSKCFAKIQYLQGIEFVQYLITVQNYLLPAPYHIDKHRLFV